MNSKITIRKILFIGIWIVIGAGMLALLIAAIGKKKHELCEDYSIVIKGKQDNFFIDEKDVEKLLVTAMNGKIKNRQISQFNLKQLEQLLENNNWIKDAQLYFDNHDALHVTITEREPLARIFTTTGNSFYIDSMGRKMPLSDRMSARVPVFTDFPEKKLWDNRDSVLMNEVTAMAKYIYNDAFWMAQTAQVDITPDRTFEMIPVVGNHIVKLGNGEEINQKFHRLFIFYKEVLSKTGFDKYKIIDVQYAGQVIGSKRPDNTKVDLIQLRKNVEKLLQESTEMQPDTIAVIKPVPDKLPKKVDSATASVKNLKTYKDGQKTAGPNAVKTISVSNVSIPNEKKTNKPLSENENKKPKAVMPKRDN